MNADIIQANYDQLDQIANIFQQQAEQTTTLTRRLIQQMDNLQSSGWEGQGAKAFFQEMDNDVVPAVKRLANAFDKAKNSTFQIKQIIMEAEEEAASPFNGIELKYGTNAKKIGNDQEKILKDVLKTAGEKSATISSTARSSKDQARIMYNNIKEHGIKHQKGLYGDNGDKVIDVYKTNEKKTPDEIKKAMEKKINELGPEKVSKHCVDPKKMVVVDIKPSSITNKKKFEATVEAIIKDKKNNSIIKFLKPPKDPAYHIVMSITQKKKTK